MDGYPLLYYGQLLRDELDAAPLAKRFEQPRFGCMEEIDNAIPRSPFAYYWDHL